MATPCTPYSVRNRRLLHHHIHGGVAWGLNQKAYAVKLGLDVGQLYELRRRLVRKGAFGALPPRKPRNSRKASAFVPVRVVAAAGVAAGTVTPGTTLF